MQTIHQEDNIFACDAFWDEDMCQACIDATEASGYFPQAAETDNSQDNKESRTNYRVIFTSNELADAIWTMLSGFSLPVVQNFTPCGINESFRFYKYLPGQAFEKHIDRGLEKNEKEASFFSILIYLNTGFEGGQTVFDNAVIEPAVGKLVVFPHNLLHAGAMVQTGVKYILRTDIMYRRVE